MLLRLVFCLCLALGALSKTNLTSTSRVQRPVTNLNNNQTSFKTATRKFTKDQNQIAFNVTARNAKNQPSFKKATRNPIKKNQNRTSFNVTAHNAKNQKRVSFKSITREYIKANIKLQKEFNATTNHLLINYPIQKYPNYQDDGWKVYYINYYMGRYIYLKIKYVQAEKDYKKEMIDFEADAKEKLKEELWKAEDNIKNFVHSHRQTIDLTNSESKCRKRITNYNQQTITWFQHNVQKLWGNYNKIFLS